MCGKVFLHINELNELKVYIIVDTCTCWKLFFPLSLSLSKKKKKRILQNSCETKYTNNTNKKRDLHQSNCSDSTHCFCCTNDVPVVEYCRWKGESLYRGWCSKTLFTESSLNFFGNTKDFPSTHIYHGLLSLVQSNKWFSYKIWLHLKLIVLVGNIILLQLNGKGYLYLYRYEICL